MRPDVIRPERSTVTIDDHTRTTTTRFPDGTQLVARPFNDPESVARARALGYHGTDEEAVWQMTRYHDLLHTLIAEARGQECSPTLHAVASGGRVDGATVRDEECLVMFVARALNVGVAA